MSATVKLKISFRTQYFSWSVLITALIAITSNVAGAKVAGKDAYDSKGFIYIFFCLITIFYITIFKAISNVFFCYALF